METEPLIRWDEKGKVRKEGEKSKGVTRRSGGGS